MNQFLSEMPTADCQSSSSRLAQERPRLPFWRHPILVVVAALLLATLGCNVASLTPPQAAPPEPTRALLPTFTNTPATLGPVVVITPPRDSTPGVIVLPPGADVGAIVSLLPTITPKPISAGETITDSTGEVPVLPGESPIPTPSETPTFTPLPTDTGTPTFTPTPSVTPTPFVVSEGGLVALRSGPGVEYPLVAQLGSGIRVSITGRNAEGTWFLLCCISGTSLWVAGQHISVVNDTINVPIVGAANPPPPPTPLPIPTETATATPTALPTRYPFELGIGPRFHPTNNNNMVTIWVKFFVGALQTPSGCEDSSKPPIANKETPAEGYFIKVYFDGSERPANNDIKPSTGGLYFACSSPPGHGTRIEYNYKYEWQIPDPLSSSFREQWEREHPAVNGVPVPIPPQCELVGYGTWSMIVVDGTGEQLSDPVTFTTQGCANPHREIYVGWVRTR